VCSNNHKSWVGSKMGMVALVLVALIVGWLGTLALVRDLSRVQLRDFLIAATGALLAGLILPRMGFEVLGENGLRLSTVFAMALASILTLVAANLIRGRGLRAGALLSPLHHEPSGKQIAPSPARD
jgi:uncharacterized membrane protein YeaQ/YmgE (transglycosylase-associated protein family)